MVTCTAETQQMKLKTNKSDVCAYHPLHQWYALHLVYHRTTRS